VAGPTGAILTCWRCALLHRPMLRRSLTIAAVVGSVLALVNHGDTVWRGEWTRTMGLKIALTYCVPFAVATASALVNSRVPAAKGTARNNRDRASGPEP
jgi:hypothetical protein